MSNVSDSGLHARSKPYRRLDRALQQQKLPAEEDIQEYLTENELSSIPVALAKPIDDLTKEPEVQAARCIEQAQMTSRREALRKAGHEKILQVGDAAAQFFFDEGAQATSISNLLLKHLTWASNLLYNYRETTDVGHFLALESVQSFNHMLKPSRLLFFGDENNSETHLLRDFPFEEKDIYPYRQNYYAHAAPPSNISYMDVDLARRTLVTVSLDPETAEVLSIGSKSAPLNPRIAAEAAHAAQKKPNPASRQITPEEQKIQAAIQKDIREKESSVILSVLTYNPFADIEEAPTFDELLSRHRLVVQYSPMMDAITKRLNGEIADDEDGYPNKRRNTEPINPSPLGSREKRNEPSTEHPQSPTRGALRPRRGGRSRSATPRYQSPMATDMSGMQQQPLFTFQHPTQQWQSMQPMIPPMMQQHKIQQPMQPSFQMMPYQPMQAQAPLLGNHPFMTAAQYP